MVVLASIMANSIENIAISYYAEGWIVGDEVVERTKRVQTLVQQSQEVGCKRNVFLFVIVEKVTPSSLMLVLVWIVNATVRILGSNDAEESYIKGMKRRNKVVQSMFTFIAVHCTREMSDALCCDLEVSSWPLCRAFLEWNK